MARSPVTTDDLRQRIEAARSGMQAQGWGAMLVSPGPDLTYLTGYDAIPLERLTCLVVRDAGDPFLVVPELEIPAAEASPAGALGLDLLPWSETEDPFAKTAEMIGPVTDVAVDNHMWAEKTLRFADVLGARLALAGPVIGSLRMRKSPEEIDALRQAGSAIDAVHARVHEWLRAGRTEREVGADIERAIFEAGHERVDFVIVASGPNGASPHHELSDRVIEVGDPVVVDIGGTTAAGYCSDSTRMYSVGEPPAEFREYYEVLQQAQWAAVQAVRPGVPCQDIDAIARDIIAGAGYGDLFIHRTGHGIGLQTHEEPYIVAG
ncbi:MAG: Xaa-Pro peptidase family protein, partial [Candidatus Nanopelagicales bacterium]